MAEALTVLCDSQIHLIQKLADGPYTCLQCGALFHEHHVLILQTGVGAAMGAGAPADWTKGRP